MDPDSIGARQFTNSSNGAHKQALDFSDDRTKTRRHPRWTRRETLVLIERKKFVENQVQRGRRSRSVLGKDQSEPKWDLISSYCRRHGVDKGPVQCQKRWGNMLCDFRKIKTWESENREVESFWIMRNESRKERKLPSSFDREVYDVLDGKVVATEAIPLVSVTLKSEMDNDHGEDNAVAEEEDDEEEQAEAMYESGLQSSAEDGLFLDPAHSGQDGIGWSTNKETAATENPTKTPISCFSGMKRRENHDSKTRTEARFGDGSKKRRLSSSECEDANDENRLIEVLARNSNMLHAQLETQNQNCELDRKQREECNDSLVVVLNKLTDALIKIANKL